MAVTVAAGDVVAAGSGATGWSARCAYEISGDLYVVTQDSALHVWKSTDDGATWSEMDGSNAPGVNSASNSWSSEVGNGFIQALFFGTATALNLIRFSLSTDEWEGSIVGNDSAAANPTAPVRLTVHSNSQWIRFTDGSDDTDLRVQRRTTGNWSTASLILSATSEDRSIVTDVIRGHAGEVSSVTYYDAANADVSHRSARIVTSVLVQGGEFDLDPTAATSHADHAPALYQPYGSNAQIIAFIDADGSIAERIGTPTGTNGELGSSDLTSQRQVTSSTAYAGGKLSTCQYDGDLYTFGSKADGTSIDYWIDTGSGWDGGAGTNVTTGTGLHLAQALPVAGVGILLIYQSGSDVVVDWAVDGPEEEPPAFTPVLIKANAVVAAGSGATGWSAKSIFEDGGDLYVFAQDTGGSPRLRVYRSTNDGATWAEQDASNAPAVTNGAYSWGSSHLVSSTGIVTARFVGTNTLRAREFSTTSNTWAGSDQGGADATTDADNVSPIRVRTFSAGTVVAYTSASDTADLAVTGRFSGAWEVRSDLSITSAERSIYVDMVSGGNVNLHRVQYNVSSDAFQVRSLYSFGGAVFLEGNVEVIDSSAATNESSHAPGTFDVYTVSSSPYTTVAYIDSDGSINENEIGINNQSATRGTQRQVTPSTDYAGGKISTCQYDGDRYVFASKADGTSIDYWVFNGSAWGSGGNVATGTGLHLSQALPVEEKGIIVSYQNGSDVMVSWAVDGPEEEPATLPRGYAFLLE